LSAVHFEHPVDGRFGPDIALLGYDLGSTSLEPGETLDLKLYWQALARPAEQYTLAIQLIAATPGETDTLVNFNTWTGGGGYPTGLWHAGDIIVDPYHLQVPDQVARAQGWYLQVVLFRLSDGTRLPFTLGGGPAGESAVLSLLRVGASEPVDASPPQADQLDPAFYFEESIALDGLRMAMEGEVLELSMWWRSVAPLYQDATIFLHLYDAEGQLIATADAPPLSGGFPTSLWQPGDRVRDERTVPLPEGGVSPVQLGIGWYDPGTGIRLAATTADGERLPDDTVKIQLAP
jgi:hypothetical protein